MSTRNWILACLGMVLLVPLTASAQRGGGGPGGGGPGGGFQGGPGGGGFDPAQFRQMQLQQMQEQMAADDQEWKVISPKLEAVMVAQQDANTGRGRGGGRGGRGGGPGGGGPGGGGPGGPGGQAATTPVAKAMQDLQTVVENPNSTADQIAAKVTALRDARAKAAATLAAAQKALREVLTPRQEALLITMSYLD